MRSLPLWLCLVLAGCVQTHLHSEVPALLAADAGNAVILQAALHKALGQPVTIAADALTRDSSLVIEATPPRIDGQRIDGRETRPPERFTLLQSNGACLLRRDNTGEHLPLDGARCRALTP